MSNYIKVDGRWQRAGWRTLAFITALWHQERYCVDANGYQIDFLSPRRRGRGVRPDGFNRSLVLVMA